MALADKWRHFAIDNTKFTAFVATSLNLILELFYLFILVKKIADDTVSVPSGPVRYITSYHIISSEGAYNV